MRYSLHEIDQHQVVGSTIAADCDGALEWFCEKLCLMLAFEGDPGAANYLLHEWPEGLLAHCKSHHSGLRGQRSNCTPPGISRRWMWSDWCLSMTGSADLPGNKIATLNAPLARKELTSVLVEREHF